MTHHSLFIYVFQAQVQILILLSVCFSPFPEAKSTCIRKRSNDEFFSCIPNCENWQRRALKRTLMKQDQRDLKICLHIEPCISIFYSGGGKTSDGGRMIQVEVTTEGVQPPVLDKRPQHSLTVPSTRPRLAKRRSSLQGL